MQKEWVSIVWADPRSDVFIIFFCARVAVIFVCCVLCSLDPIVNLSQRVWSYIFAGFPPVNKFMRSWGTWWICCVNTNYKRKEKRKNKEEWNSEVMVVIVGTLHTAFAPILELHGSFLLFFLSKVFFVCVCVWVMVLRYWPPLTPVFSVFLKWKQSLWTTAIQSLRQATQYWTHTQAQVTHTSAHRNAHMYSFLV